MPRLRNAKNPYISKEKILKLQDNSQGYLRIVLNVNGKKEKFFIHRLVAEHFINKPKECNIVNHLDCNPHNNTVDNLEWTTLKGNSEYMKKLERNKRTEKWIEKLQKSLNEKMAKKVLGIEINGYRLLEFNSVNETKKYGFQPSSVSCCCNKKRNTHKGFIWRFI